MRLAIAACVFALVACSPPTSGAATTAEDAAGPSGAGRVEASVSTPDVQAIVGRWSFDRSCGLYDLVFNADATANYYDYADERHVVSYAGRWTRSDDNRLVLSLHRLSETGAPTGEALTYSLNVSDPISDDLIGQFGPTGGTLHAITAKRCVEEDRE